MILEIFLFIILYTIVSHVIDYRILKPIHFKKHKWDLNISCGFVDGGGLNADVVQRNVKNFIKVENIYKLPFKDKQFDNVVSSHTIEHVDNPEAFYNELKRVSKNVTLLIPPIWDIAAVGFFMEHKWQFLTLKTKHVNILPKSFKLPYWKYQKKFGQRIK